MASPHRLTTPDGAVYDLRWVISFKDDLSKITATFFGSPYSPVIFDRAAFLAQWDASRAGNPAFLGCPAIGALPDLILGQITLNVLMVTRFVDYPALAQVYAWLAQSAMAEDAQVPVDVPIRIPRATFLAAWPSGLPWWNPGGGSSYYNLDWVTSWNRETTAMTRFADSPDVVIGLPRDALETAMQASKTRS